MELKKLNPLEELVILCMRGGLDFECEPMEGVGSILTLQDRYGDELDDAHMSEGKLYVYSKPSRGHDLTAQEVFEYWRKMV